MCVWGGGGGERENSCIATSQIQFMFVYARNSCIATCQVQFGEHILHVSVCPVNGVTHKHHYF